MSDQNRPEVCTALTGWYGPHAVAAKGKMKWIPALVCNDGVLLLVRTPEFGVGLLTGKR